LRSPTPPSVSHPPAQDELALSGALEKKKLKHVAEAPAARCSPAKKVVKNAAEIQSDALGALGQRLNSFGIMFREAVSGRSAGLDATPVCFSHAMKLVQAQEKHRLVEDQLDLIKLFGLKDGKTSMDKYLHLTDEGLRDLWVRARLREAEERREEKQFDLRST
jgi:hypothetical protein